jgi:trehalose-6-phosphate synthase
MANTDLSILFLSIISEHTRTSLILSRTIVTVSEINSHQTLKKDEFYALLSVADLGVITPLRDGMNTTSMEFVIAQEKTQKSPIVLSEFMGISKNMKEALQVNPWNLGVR